MNIINKLCRVLLVLFACYLFISSCLSFVNYFKDHKAPKVACEGLVVKVNDKKAISYQDQTGKTHKALFVDHLMLVHKTGKHMTVYYDKDRPQRLYYSQQATGELIFASVQLGWGLLIGLMLFYEWWIIRRLERQD